MNALKDEDTEILEIGLLAGHDLDYGSIPRATLMTCIAWIQGIPVCIGGSDATVKVSYKFWKKLAERSEAKSAKRSFASKISITQYFLPTHLKLTGKNNLRRQLIVF